MNKISLVLVLLSITYVLSDSVTCRGQPLLAKFGLPVTGKTYIESGIKYCKSLQSSPSCCTAETINAFQDKADTLTETIRTAVVARDKFLIKTRDQVLPGLKSTLNRLKIASDSAAVYMTKLFQTAATQSGDGGSGDQTLGEDQMSILMISMFGEIARLVTDKLPELKGNFTLYQKGRATCIVEMVKLQAAAWCLACDPKWASKGVSILGKITLSNNLCKRLSSSCFDFISRTNDQNMILQVRYLAPVLDKLSAAMEAMVKGDLTGMREFGNLEQDESITPPANENEAPAQVSDSCTAEYCSFICEDVFQADGIIQESLLAAGGDVSMDSSSRLLVEKEEDDPTTQEGDVTTNQGGDGPTTEGGDTTTTVEEGTVTNEGGTTTITEGGWDVGSDESLITATFEADPANVNNGSSSALLIKGAVIGALGLFVTLFI